MTVFDFLVIYPMIIMFFLLGLACFVQPNKKKNKKKRYMDTFHERVSGVSFMAISFGMALLVYVM